VVWCDVVRVLRWGNLFVNDVYSGEDAVSR